MDYREFASSIRAKHPYYEKVKDDFKLASAMVSKFPYYDGKVDFDLKQLSPSQVSELPQSYRTKKANQMIAEKMRKSTPTAKEAISEARLKTIQEENPTLSALFPRLAKAKSEDRDDFLPNVAGGISDVLSGAGRTVSAVTRGVSDLMDDEKTMADVGRRYMETLQGIEGKNIVEQIAKDPRTALGLLYAPALAPMLKSGTLGMLGAGLAEGVITGAGGQLANIGEGKQIDPVEAGLDVGISTAMPVIGAGFKKTVSPLIKKTFEKVVNPNVTRLTSELSGISQEALDVASSTRGRQKLIEMSGRSQEIGTKVLDALENIDDNLHLEDRLRQALNNMPEVSTAPIIESLEESIKKVSTGLKTDAKETAKEVLGRQLENLKMLPEKISAPEYRALRGDLDYMVKFDDVGSDLINKALYGARTSAKNALVKAGKGTDYSDIMKEYSDVLDIREKIFNYIGKKPHIREGRIEGFINNLFGKNKTARQSLLQDLDKVLGEDFTKQAKLATLSNEVVKDGKAIPFFPVQTTGRSLMGSIGSAGALVTGVATGQPALVAAGLSGMVSSSPRLSTLGLQAMKATPQVLENIAVNPILQRTIPLGARIPIQRGLE